jgi:uncharacterized protein with HEPN domain
MTEDRTRERVSMGIEHLENAIEYSHRGRSQFFDPENPDTQRLVEGELRKAYEALNRLGDPFYNSNPSIPREEIARVRQLLTHDYADADPGVIWRIVTQEAPPLLRRLLKAKTPIRPD